MKGLLIFLIIVITAPEAIGRTYKYIDNTGTTGFTDDLKSIPEKYRKSAVLLSEESNKVHLESPPPPPQADAIDESLLPPKVEPDTQAPSDAAVAGEKEGPASGNFYMNIAIISSFFIFTLVPSFFVNNRIFRRVLRMASVASVLILLLYTSAHFASIQMAAVKKDAAEMKEMVRKKEELKQKEINEVLRDAPPEHD